MLPSPLLSGLLAASAAAAPAAPTPTLDLEQAVQVAERLSADVIRAKDDVLLVDVDRLRAYSVILPQVSVDLNLGESFQGSPILETRSQTLTPLTPADIAKARVGFGPFIDLKASDASSPVIRLGLTASQLIYDGGRWWTTIDKVDDLQRARRTALAVVRSNLRQLVATRFYDLARAEKDVETFKVQVSLSEAQLERARALLKAGTGRQSDVAAAERNLATDRQSLAVRVFTIGSRRRTLNTALAWPPEHPTQLVLEGSVRSATTALPAIALPPEATALELAIQKRPDLSNSRALLESAKKDIRINEAGYWPVVSFALNYNRQSRRPDRVFNDPTTNYYAGMGLDAKWDVFQGRAITANVQQAEIELRRAETSYEELERSVRAEVLERIERLRTLIEVHRLSLDGARAAEEAVRLAEGLYRQGKGILLELRDAQLQLTQARLGAINARLDVEVAREDLRHAIGVDPNGTTPATAAEEME